MREQERGGKHSLTQRQTLFTRKRGRGGKTTSERGCGSSELPLHPIPPSLYLGQSGGITEQLDDESWH